MAELAPRMPDVALRLLGEPNPRLSTRHDWRFGSHGSLSIDPETGTFYDFEAGEGGGVLAFAKRVLRCSTAEALAWIEGNGVTAAPELPRPITKGTPPEKVTKAAALKLWAESHDPRGTVVETYLAHRGVALPTSCAALRYHPACIYERHKRLPAMVALFRDICTDEPLGIHRTFLTLKGQKVDRKMLGRTIGAAIKLSDDAEVTTALGVAEGIETALSVISAGWQPVWALGAAGLVSRFPVLDGIEAITAFADNDPAGLGAARSLARRWADAGREAYVQVPPRAGADFNDIVKEAPRA